MKLTQLLPLLALVLAYPASAQTPAAEPEKSESKVILTPAQTEHILKELEKVEAQIGKGRGSVFSTALAKFREGMASPAAALALYLDCYKLEHFDRKNLKQTDFMDWRNKNEANLKDEDFKRALWLQLEYLVLTIQAQEIDEPREMAPIVTSVQAFLAKAITAVQGATTHSASGAVTDKDVKGGGQGGGGGGRRGGGGGNNVPAGDIMGTLRQSVASSEFAKAYSLEDFLKRDEWEYQPLNVRGIYSNIVFPYYLAEKPTDLPVQWDSRISAEVAMQKAIKSETEFDEYYKDAGPRMTWEKNNYLVQRNVAPVIALADMLKVIQNYPSHPDAMNWLKEFRELVKEVSEPTEEAAAVEKPVGSQ
ncbi:MAG: hypothetical protein K9N47_01985 [Prosthecobacter sp.]|uniref:hypothetical protein n=1 Tax=Prosthecobacter sp. TaxID=1965333 RepID=UPI0025D6E0A3|nr:hypothetical protein [Prosthecobacter sp.]MCF7784857.1 hypothetical protein [Prosthecobacter sp.]